MSRWFSKGDDLVTRVLTSISGTAQILLTLQVREHTLALDNVSTHSLSDMERLFGASVLLSVSSFGGAQNQRTVPSIGADTQVSPVTFGRPLTS